MTPGCRQHLGLNQNAVSQYRKQGRRFVFGEYSGWRSQIPEAPPAVSESGDKLGRSGTSPAQQLATLTRCVGTLGYVRIWRFCATPPLRSNLYTF